MNNVFLTISEGDRIGVVGRNGAGKSTFLRLLSGKEEPDHGEISVKRGMSVAYLPQTPVLREDDTITQAALDYLPARQGKTRHPPLMKRRPSSRSWALLI